MHGLRYPGIDREQNEELQIKVETILANIGDKPVHVVKDCCRVGRNRENATRPVKFSLRVKPTLHKC
jgi:hypothetical protein